MNAPNTNAMPIARLLGLAGRAVRVFAGSRPAKPAEPKAAAMEVVAPSVLAPGDWYDAMYSGKRHSGVMIIGTNTDGSQYFAYLP